MTDTPMTLAAALTRLRQYGERTSTWSIATYNDGTEKALHEIALTLAAEVDRLSDDVTGACLARYEEEQDADRLRLALASAQRGRRELRGRVTELEAAPYTAPSPSCTRCYGADAARFVTNGGAMEPCRVCAPSEVEQLRARVAELEALKPARFQDCPKCGAGYEYGQPCPSCEFKKLMAADPAKATRDLPLMTADEWNAQYPVGTPVTAYPGCRPEDDPKCTRLVTHTRTAASVLGGHTAVVWVDGHSSCISLTHVDPVLGVAP